MELKKKKKWYNGLFKDFGLKLLLACTLILGLVLIYMVGVLIICAFSLSIKKTLIGLIVIAISYMIVHVLALNNK